MAFGGEVRKELENPQTQVCNPYQWRFAIQKLNGQRSKFPRSTCNDHRSKFFQIPSCLTAAETLRAPISDRVFSGHGLLLGGHL